VISEKEYTKDSNQFVVPPSGGSFKVPGQINKGAVDIEIKSLPVMDYLYFFFSKTKTINNHSLKQILIWEHSPKLFIPKSV